MTITAQDLCQALSAARAAELGALGITDPATRYYPKGWFNWNVQVLAPDGTPTKRAERYCAIQAAAESLAQLLGATSMVYGNAINFSGLLDSWNDTELVPYLIFTGGEKQSRPVNAGVLLDYFNGASNPATEQDGERAMEKALFEIKGAF